MCTGFRGFSGVGGRFRGICRGLCAGFGRISGLSGVGIICATYGTTVAIPGMGRVVALFSTAGASMPVTVVVLAPVGGEVMRVPQSCLDHIAAGGASLGGGFGRCRARCVGRLIRFSTANAAFVPVAVTVLAPVGFVAVGGGTSSTTKVTFSVAVVVIAVGAVDAANAAGLVHRIEDLVAGTVIVPNCIR